MKELITYLWQWIDLDKAKDITAIATFIIAAITAVFVANKFYRDQTVVRALKAIDVAIHCANRYNDLLKLKAGIPKSDRASEKDGQLITAYPLRDWYRQFWALKSDQFDFWLSGVLDHDSFFDWNCHLVQKITIELRQKEEDRTRPVEEGFVSSWNIEKGEEGAKNGISHAGTNPRFMRFNESLFDLALAGLNKSGLEEVVFTSRAVLSLMEEFETGIKPKSNKSRWKKLNRIRNNFIRWRKGDLSSAVSWRKHFWRGMSFSDYRAFVENDLEKIIEDNPHLA